MHLPIYFQPRTNTPSIYVHATHLLTTTTPPIYIYAMDMLQSDTCTLDVSFFMYYDFAYQNILEITKIWTFQHSAHVV